MHALIARGRREDGFAVIVTLVVIVIVAMLAGTVVASAVLTSRNGNHDYARKQAIAGANAGLQAALYRLGSQSENTSTQREKCFTTEFVERAKCPAGEHDEIGNGVSYTYYVSPVFTKAENSCTGLWVLPPSGKEVSQRCITSIGTARGETARVQERVADVYSTTPTSIFPVNGIFSYSTLEFTNEMKLAGEIGARTTVLANKTIENSSELKVKYGTKAELKGGPACASTCTQMQLTSPELAAAPYALPAQDPAPYASSQSANNNSSMTFTSGSINANREITSASGTITIPAGTYNLCLISISNEVTINYTPPIKLYLDSPNRTTGSPASNCPPGTGTFKMTNKVTWADLSASPKSTDLQIFVWGNPSITPPGSSSPKFEFNNAVGGPLYALIYAPYSSVQITNKMNMVGSIAGGWVKMSNKVEMIGEGGGSGPGGGTTGGTTFWPTAYHVCPPSYSGSNPASGCY